ncbi:hypothetical protein ACS0TY_004463 [Phlomoides rotata]
MIEKLGAAVGATRAAVDAGFVPNGYSLACVLVRGWGEKIGWFSCGAQQRLPRLSPCLGSSSSKSR